MCYTQVPWQEKGKQTTFCKALQPLYITIFPVRKQTSENKYVIFCIRNPLLICLFLQVQDTSFILCIVVIQPEIPVKQLKNLNTVPSSKLLYHRLDLLGQPSACLHFKQLATLGDAQGLPHFLHYLAHSDHKNSFQTSVWIPLPACPPLPAPNPILNVCSSRNCKAARYDGSRPQCW